MRMITNLQVKEGEKESLKCEGNFLDTGRMTNAGLKRRAFKMLFL